jgi:hypothetical protein
MDTNWFSHIEETKWIKSLASDFGLPCIENKNNLTIVGEKQLLIFKKQEETQCQLIEIY